MKGPSGPVWVRAWESACAHRFDPLYPSLGTYPEPYLRSQTPQSGGGFPPPPATSPRLVPWRAGRRRLGPDGPRLACGDGRRPGGSPAARQRGVRGGRWLARTPLRRPEQRSRPAPRRGVAAQPVGSEASARTLRGGWGRLGADGQAVAAGAAGGRRHVRWMGWAGDGGRLTGPAAPASRGEGQWVRWRRGAGREWRASRPRRSLTRARSATHKSRSALVPRQRRQ